MPEIFGSNIDNHIIVGPTADTFANIRNDDGTGSDVTLGTASDTKNSFCISVYKFMGRGADQFRIHRTFLYFDTSGNTLCCKLDSHRYHLYILGLIIYSSNSVPISVLLKYNKPDISLSHVLSII